MTLPTRKVIVPPAPAPLTHIGALFRFRTLRVDLQLARAEHAAAARAVQEARARFRRACVRMQDLKDRAHGARADVIAALDHEEPIE